MRVGDGLRVTCERLAGDLQQDRERVANDWRAPRSNDGGVGSNMLLSILVMNNVEIPKERKATLKN